MNCETNPHLNSPESRATIDSLREKAISNRYFTTTGEYVSDDEDLEEVARLAYYDWCESHDRPPIEHDVEESAISCSHDRPLTPASSAQLHGLAEEFGLKIGGHPADQSPYIHIDLSQGTGSYSGNSMNEQEFLSRLAAILTDPRSFHPSPA
jgi:hypothetical protein